MGTTIQYFPKSLANDIVDIVYWKCFYMYCPKLHVQGCKLKHYLYQEKEIEKNKLWYMHLIHKMHILSLSVYTEIKI